MNNSQNLKKLVSEYITLKRENNRLLDIQPGMLPGMESAKYLTEVENKIYKENEKRIEQIKKEIRTQVGFWNYLLFVFDRSKFYDKFNLV